MRTSLISYVGGKSKVYRALRKYFPIHDNYIEPFCGGGSVFFSKRKTASWLNDKAYEMWAIYHQCQTNWEEFAEYLIAMPDTKEFYDDLKTQTPSTEFEIAAQTYHLLRLGYGSIPNSYSYCLSTGITPLTKMRFWQVHQKLKGVKLTNLDFRDVLSTPIPENTFLFLDPPYYDLPYYTHNFDESDFQDFRDCLDNIRNKAKFVMTINDHPRVREIFADYYIQPYSLDYVLHGYDYNRTELMITNYTGPKQLALS